MVWADARGLPASRVARALVARVAELEGGDATAGVADTPVVAEMAARLAARQPPSSPEPGADRGWRAEADGRVVVVVEERHFLAGIPLAWLGLDEWLAALLDGVGIATCGELAALEREAVEVRFGPDGVRLWKLARGDDPRRLFAPAPRDLPGASIDFVDYVLTDPARLIFAANALLGSICDALDARGEHARRLLLRLELANGEEWRRTLRAARPTASRERWLRLIRSQLERITVPDAIVAIHLEVEATEEAAARQGDLFDPGFATAGAVEAALERLAESYGPVVVAPESDAHPLPERRTRWRPRDPVEAAGRPEGRAAPKRMARADRGRGIPPAPEPGESTGPRPGGTGDVGGVLTLQLLPEPLPIRVEAVPRRDHEAPVRYHDGRRWRAIVTAAGPDRLSGGNWDEPFAREYFRCVDGDGRLVWIYRDGLTGRWHLHGWWD